jgi:hypothetical protein
MGAMNRREALQALGAASMAAGFAWTGDEVSAAHDLAQVARAVGRPATPVKPKFFTSHEYETVRVLVDLIIPRDERSGSATDVGVPEFLDFILIDEPRLAEETSRQTAMRGGLAWIDLECQRRFDRTFVACTEAERTALLDEISKPPPPAAALSGGRGDMDEAPQLLVLSHGRAFFASPAISRPPASGRRRWEWRTCSTRATDMWRAGTAARTRR